MSLSTLFAERSLLQHIRGLWALAVQTARLIVGVPDYEVYLAHMRRAHPEKSPMSREEFFGERMQARYGRGASRCC